MKAHDSVWHELQHQAVCEEEFADFHQELHGYPPFPWQKRLVRRLCDQEGWPDILDLPTGAGKTTAMDIALFALAVDAAHAASAADVKLARRIFLVVDRRVVVDQAGERARKIAEHLMGDAEPGSVTEKVAESLCRLSGSNVPVLPAVLRGGVRRDDAWARHPAQVILGASTVDQVGSRLLFRGYGTSPRTRSIHAGLLAHDTIYLLDEVHISRPFDETLKALTGRYSTWANTPRLKLASSVALSATASSESEDIFQLDEEDRENQLLRQRLSARKSVQLEQSQGGGDTAFVKMCVKVAKTLGEQEGRVGVIVNRVHTARLIHAQLSERDEDAAILITGRMRPLDRKEQAKSTLKFLESGRDRNVEGGPKYVIATQTIEVGADLDFDFMVTECASWDALVQRAGRLDRLGVVSQEGGSPKLVIIGRQTAVKKGAEPDPIYGYALSNTWQWITSHEELVLSPDRASRPEPPQSRSDEPSTAYRTPSLRAPLLLPSHLDSLAQTSPTPMHDPDVQAFLHGQREQRAEVRVIWRKDISLEQLLRPGLALEELRTQLSMRPPGSIEAISLPIGVVQRWLTGGEEPEFGDLEVNGPEASRQGNLTREGGRPFVRWQGDESEVVRSPWKMRPDDVVIVPASYGGIDPRSLNWNPDSTRPVEDLGDLCQWSLRRRPTRLLKLRAKDRRAFEAQGDLKSIKDALQNQESIPLDAVRPEQSSETVEDKLCEQLDQGPAPTIRFFESWEDHEDRSADPGVWCIVSSSRPLPSPQKELETSNALRFEDEKIEAVALDENTSFVGRPVTLKGHLERVARRAAQLAELCGLSDELITTLERVGLYHDLGKVDRRFQCWLYGGDEISMLAEKEPLAKSATPENDRLIRRRAREAAGYPAGYRHEAMSVALLENTENALLGTHSTLTLHLIASHHGYARPFFPVVDDSDPIDIETNIGDERVRAVSAHGLARLDSGVAKRFWALNEEFGWHGLAWLEAIFRLADWDVSREEALERR